MVNSEVWVQDLGSGRDTWDNEEPLAGPRRLLPAESLRIPSFTLRFEQGSPSAQPSFMAGEQSAGTIDMVGGNQFNLQQRESMLREIAAAKTRGWRLIILGFVLYFVGGGLFASGVLRFIAQAAGGTGRNVPRHPFGAEIMNIPSGLIGWALARVGRPPNLASRGTRLTHYICLPVTRHLDSRRPELEVCVSPFRCPVWVRRVSSRYDCSPGSENVMGGSRNVAWYR
jgi:hypothetical protein